MIVFAFKTRKLQRAFAPVSCWCTCIFITGATVATWLTDRTGVVTDITKPAPLAEIFLAPMLAHLAGAKAQRLCPEISDRDWVILGTCRTLEDEPSGRAFLQKSRILLTAAPVRSSFLRPSPVRAAAA